MIEELVVWDTNLVLLSPTFSRMDVLLIALRYSLSNRKYKIYLNMLSNAEEHGALSYIILEKSVNVNIISISIYIYEVKEVKSTRNVLR